MQACDAIQCAERRRKKPRVDVRPYQLPAHLFLSQCVFSAPHPAPGLIGQAQCPASGNACHTT